MDCRTADLIWKTRQEKLVKLIMRFRKYVRRFPQGLPMILYEGSEIEKAQNQRSARQNLLFNINQGGLAHLLATGETNMHSWSRSVAEFRDKVQDIFWHTFADMSTFRFKSTISTIGLVGDGADPEVDEF